MKVISPLADIDFGVGRISRSGENLIVESAPESTLETQIVVTPADARATLRKVLASGDTWRFLLSALFRRGGQPRPDGAIGTDEWRDRRRRTGLNKPW